MELALKICNRFHPSVARAAVFAVLALSSAAIAFGGPIHDAARKGDANKIKALLQQDPKLVSDKDKNGDTPLHVAALHGQVAAVQALLDAGADVNAKNNYGPFTPGDLWDKVLASNNHQDPVGVLTVHGDDTRYMQNGYTPLHLAVFSIKHKQIVEMLVNKGADINAQPASGATPLFFAVIRDQKDDVQFLLDHGANVNLPDAYGDTCLDMALRLQYMSVIPILIDKGADVNAIDQSEHRPLFYAMNMDDHKWADVLRKKGAHD
jgi:ankyrin repeat protein